MKLCNGFPRKPTAFDMFFKNYSPRGSLL